MSRRTKKPPGYRHFKPRNHAVVRIAGRELYLGPYGSAESHAAYLRLLAEHSLCDPTAVASRKPSLQIDFSESTGRSNSRVLVEFVATGLARRIAFGDSIGQYEAVGVEIESQVAALRRYFLCADCDTAFRLPDEEVAAEVQTSFGFVDEAISKGRCRDCCDGSKI